MKYDELLPRYIEVLNHGKDPHVTRVLLLIDDERSKLFEITCNTKIGPGVAYSGSDLTRGGNWELYFERTRVIFHGFKANGDFPWVMHIKVDKNHVYAHFWRPDATHPVVAWED